MGAAPTPQQRHAPTGPQSPLHSQAEPSKAASAPGSSGHRASPQSKWLGSRKPHLSSAPSLMQSGQRAGCVCWGRLLLPSGFPHRLGSQRPVPGQPSPEDPAPLTPSCRAASNGSACLGYRWHRRGLGFRAPGGLWGSAEDPQGPSLYFCRAGGAELGSRLGWGRGPPSQQPEGPELRTGLANPGEEAPCPAGPPPGEGRLPVPPGRWPRGS